MQLFRVGGLVSPITMSRTDDDWQVKGAVLCEGNMEEQKIAGGLAIGLTWPDTRKPRVSSSAACRQDSAPPTDPAAVQTLRTGNGTLREVSADLLSSCYDEFEKAQRSCSQPSSSPDLESGYPCEREDLTWRKPESDQRTRTSHGRRVRRC